MNDKELRQAVGQRLQEIRGRRDQRGFAEAVDSVQQTISKYERGEIPRSWLFLARLAEAEGVDLNLLLTGIRASGSGSGGNGSGQRASEPRREPAGAPV
jgi:transcriptional regulator with XRE-family HTH domain